MIPWTRALNHLAVPILDPAMAPAVVITPAVAAGADGKEPPVNFMGHDGDNDESCYGRTGSQESIEDVFKVSHFRLRLISAPQ